CGAGRWPPGAMCAVNSVSSPFVSNAVLWKTSRSPVCGFSTVCPATIISVSSVCALPIDTSSMRRERVCSHWGDPQIETPILLGGGTVAGPWRDRGRVQIPCKMKLLSARNRDPGIAGLGARPARPSDEDGEHRVHDPLGEVRVERAAREQQAVVDGPEQQLV